MDCTSICSFIAANTLELPARPFMISWYEDIVDIFIDMAFS